MSFDADIVVAGGGPVGACAAALLAPGRKVMLLEPSAEPCEARQLSEPSAEPRELPPPDRVVALSRASERILRHCGAWASIAPQAHAYERMHVWHESTAPDGATALHFDAAEAGEPNLGWIVPNAIVQRALLSAFQAAGGEIRAARLAAARFESDAVTVDAEDAHLRARLLIGADGARSAVREIVGIAATISAYRQTAIVATVETGKPHEDTAWQRFLSGGTLAFLPLGNGASSIVWSVSEEEGERLLALDAARFETELLEAADRFPRSVRLLSTRAAFPLQRLTTPHYVTERCALIGDAVHVVHPLAGQGVNLGFLDAAALAQVIAGAPPREDPGALATLRRYERWRRTENRWMDGAIDAFNRFLAHGRGPVSGLARRGLGIVERSTPLKRVFVRYALGVDGELPEAARRPSSSGNIR